MPLFHTYTESTYLTWSASGTSTLDLPRNGYITQIDCHLVVNNTPAATVVSATDPLALMISSARVHAAGQTYFDIGDGRDWYYWTYFRHRGAARADALPAASAGATNSRAMFEIHLGFEAQRTPTAYQNSVGNVVRSQIGGVFDPTVVIPAVRLSNPQLEVKWGGASVLGTGYTINTGYMYVTIHEIVLEPGEREEDLWPGGLLVPRVESTSVAMDSTHTNKSLRHDVPTRLVLYQTLALVLNGSSVRSDTMVSEFSVEFPPQRETPVDLDWYDAVMENRKRTEVPSDIAGAYFLEWPLVSGNELGIDLTDKNVGDVQIGLSNAGTASSTCRFLHIGYLPERAA